LILSSCPRLLSDAREAAAEAALGCPEFKITNPPCGHRVSGVHNIVGWFGTAGVLEALRRRAVDGGSYRVRVSLTRICLWLISLGIFDKEFATSTAGSAAEHSAIPPELFHAKTPLGTYQGMTAQIELSSLPQGLTTTVLQPMGADQPEWLPRAYEPARSYTALKLRWPPTRCPPPCTEVAHGCAGKFQRTFGPKRP